MNSERKKLYLVFILSAALYIFLQYFTFRSQYLLVLSEYITLFILYLYVLRISTRTNIFNFALGVSIVFRLLLIPSLPNLSDDFYRFIWDGQVNLLGINPFLFTPRELMATYPTLLNADLFTLMNSPDYHTVYPPLLQGIFTAAAFLSGGSVYWSVIFLKLLVFAAELITILLLLKLCAAWKIEKNSILLYALNPLVIIELTGNIHFEGLAIPFILFAILLFSRNRNFLSGLALGVAASIKLLPAIFAPAFLSNFKWTKNLRWVFAFAIVAGVALFPMFSKFFQGIGLSLDLYFRKFEFNASIYYLIREVGFWVKGYNTIASIGPALAFISSVVILIISGLAFYKKIKVEEALLFSLTAYLMFATTVHPWYVTPLLAISVITRFRFPIIWSCLIFLTYSGYSQTGYSEISLIVFLEYLITFGFTFWEIRKYLWKKKTA